MTEGEIGWISGFFEGEGSIVFTGRSSVRLKITLTDLDVLEKFQTLVGCGRISIEPSYETHHKAKWIWYVDNQKDVTNTILVMKPWLGGRRVEKANRALERLSGLKR